MKTKLEEKIVYERLMAMQIKPGANVFRRLRRLVSFMSYLCVLSRISEQISGLR